MQGYKVGYEAGKKEGASQHTGPCRLNIFKSLVVKTREGQRRILRVRGVHGERGMVRFTKSLVPFCQKSLGHICVRLFLGSLFCVTGLCVYLCTNITLSITRLLH